MSMLVALVASLYIFVPEYMSVFDLLYCVPSHCHYKLKSSSDKLLPFTFECYPPETCCEVPHVQRGHGGSCLGRDVSGVQLR